MKTSHPTGGEKAPLPVFFAAVVVIFFLSLSAADSVGFIPEYLDGSDTASNIASDSFSLSDLPQLSLSGEDAEAGVAETLFPEQILIPEIGLDLAVQNPNTRDLEELAGRMAEAI